ncbi:hypothetical protein V2J09_007217 [Rumex salicifolius]
MIVPQFSVFNSSLVGFFSSSTSSSSIRLRWACLQFVSGGPVVFFSCSSSSSSVRLFFVKVIQFVLQLFVCSSSIRVRRQFVCSSSVRLVVGLRLRFAGITVGLKNWKKKATAQERFLHKSTPIALHTGIAVDPAALEEGLRRTSYGSAGRFLVLVPLNSPGIPEIGEYHQLEICLDMGIKKNKSQKQNSAASVSEKDAKNHEGKRVITDDRPKVPKNKSKVVVDSRFSAALTSKAFAKSSAPLDKRGKLKKGASENTLSRYYNLEDEKDEEEEEEKKKKNMEKEREGDAKRGNLKAEIKKEQSEESDICEQVENVPNIEKETHRLAIVNMDWTQVKAADLFVMLSSVLPKGGQILSVSVYPSEFGLKRMEEEAIRGPAALFDGEEANKDKATGSDDDDDEIDNEKLRAYERSRLRYYYAVVVCDSVATADYLYKSCDGVEFERSSNVLDVRFIPDNMEFKHPPRDRATEAPAGYEGLDFHTRALQHSNVQISWDEDEPHRVKTLKRKFNADQLADLEMKEFLASDESEDDDEEDLSERKNKNLEKYRALLQSGDGSEEEEDEHQDMEVTFNTGLEDISKKILEKKNQSETFWEEYLRKRKEKRLKNRSKDSSDDESDYSDNASGEEPDDFFEDEPPSKKAKKAAVNKKKRIEVESIDTEKETAASAAELELLLADDNEGKNAMKGYKIKRNKIKGKKGKIEPVPEDKLPVVNRDDPRFAALYNNPNFALDPTDPQYLRSAPYARDLAQRSQRGREKLLNKEESSMDGNCGSALVNEQVNYENDKSGSSKDKHELSLLVKSVRRKSQQGETIYS